MRSGVRIVVDGHGQSGREAHLIGERQIAPVKSRHEQFLSTGAYQTGETNADAFDRSIVSRDEPAREIDDAAGRFVGVRTGSELLLLQHASGEIAGREI